MRIFARRSSIASFIIGLLLSVIAGGLIITGQILIFLLHLEQWTSLINIALVVGIAFGLAPIRRLFTHLIETFLFRQAQADKEALRLLSERLLKSSDLISVITASLDTICGRLNLPHAIGYILQKDDHNSLEVKQIVPWHHPDKDFPPLDQNESIFKYIHGRGKPLIASALRSEIAHEKKNLKTIKKATKAKNKDSFVSDHVSKVAILEVMTRLKAEIAIPLLAKGQLFGLMFFAGKPSQAPYFVDEIAFIEVAVAETITSIQRANYFEGDLQKTEFISIASHELRTPLTAIRGYLSMILDEHLTGDELDKESHHHLDQCYQMTRQLIAMVNDLLTLSRLESGKTQIQAQQVDLVDVITKALEKHRYEATAKKISLKLENQRLLPHAWADPDGITLVLTNLITNAVTFNKPGGKVSVRVHTQLTNDMIAIDISDTGIGMTKEQMSHLFERFYRVATQETAGIGGTGLGLNISQSYIQRMNGSIRVQSRPGKGSTFTVYIPLFTPERLREEAERATLDAQDASVEIREDVPIGLLLLSAKRSGEHYTSGDLALLEAVGHQAIIAIQRAKLYEGDQMKTHFVSIASHELLTPIAAIEGYISLVLAKNKKIMAPKTSDFLGNVNSAIHRLSSLVRDLLSVSRLESGKITITQQPFDIAKSIHETLVQLEFVAKERGITLAQEPLPATLPQAFADPERTTQVLMNLVGNSIKYNRPKGKVTLQVSFNKTEGALKIAVIDTGIGMSKEQMSHLFEKFYRINSQETVGIVGTGLGLYITKSIIERMGGSIAVKSIPGTGSTFTFTIPAAKKSIPSAV